MAHFFCRTTSVLSRASSNESILHALGGSSPSQSESPESKLEREVGPQQSYMLLRCAFLFFRYFCSSKHLEQKVKYHSQKCNQYLNMWIFFIQMDLASFLISRACNNTSLANYFYWYGYIYSFFWISLTLFQFFSLLFTYELPVYNELILDIR